jgi:hypothetical protein
MGLVGSCVVCLVPNSVLNRTPNRQHSYAEDGRCRPKHVGGIKWYNKQSKCILFDFCLSMWLLSRASVHPLMLNTKVFLNKGWGQEHKPTLHGSLQAFCMELPMLILLFYGTRKITCHWYRKCDLNPHYRPLIYVTACSAVDMLMCQHSSSVNPILKM